MEARAGSRRKLADCIIEGRVLVNGNPVDNLKHQIDIGRDSVSIDGNRIILEPQETVCVIINKPKGVLSTTSDERGRRTVMDILPAEYRNTGLYPAGRLDKDTTGLLLLTNNGNLTYILTHPKFEHEKEYLIHIEGTLTNDEKGLLKRGLKLKDGKTSPARIKSVESKSPYNYSLTIHEGKKRQVRRMFEKLKHPVIDLKRIRIGGLRLGNLKEGEARRLNTEEITALTNQ
jgi:23S rRNA pseudouridine2605 synthase